MTTPSLFEQGEPIIARKGEPGPGVLSVGVLTNATPAPQQAEEGWLAKIKNIFVRKKRDSQPARPVQTEWSLDKVTVVRNDLFEDDLDVVLAEVKGASASPKPVAKTRATRAVRTSEAKVSVEKAETAGTLK